MQVIIATAHDNLACIVVEQSFANLNKFTFKFPGVF